MNHYHQPTKEQVRQYMRERAQSDSPPSIDEIRHMLGWGVDSLTTHQRNQIASRDAATASSGTSACQWPDSLDEWLVPCIV